MKQWYVLHTKPRNEKKVATGLTQIGIENYCPVIIEMKQWSDRKKKVERPVLPSFVFVNIEPSKRDDVFEISGISRYLFWLGKPAVVPDYEIATLKNHLSSSYRSVTVEAITVGSKIAIESGVFKGQVATITEERSKTFKVYLETLGVLVIIEK